MVTFKVVPFKVMCNNLSMILVIAVVLMYTERHVEQIDSPISTKYEIINYHNCCCNMYLEFRTFPRIKKVLTKSYIV